MRCWPRRRCLLSAQQRIANTQIILTLGCVVCHQCAARTACMLVLKRGSVSERHLHNVHGVSSQLSWKAPAPGARNEAGDAIRNVEVHARLSWHWWASAVRKSVRSTAVLTGSRCCWSRPATPPVRRWVPGRAFGHQGQTREAFPHAEI